MGLARMSLPVSIAPCANLHRMNRAVAEIANLFGAVIGGSHARPDRDALVTKGLIALPVFPKSDEPWSSNFRT